jgi:YD repeat-containing protein
MTVTTTLNDTGQSSKVAYSYGVGLVTLPTEIQEWDYGAGTPTRTQKITYGTLSRPTSVALYAGDGSSGSPIAETTYTYDEYGASYCKNGVPMLTNVTGATNHDDTAYGSTNWTRGNPTTISRLISGTTWSTIHRCYDTLGNVTQEVDARGNPTTYGHLDSFADAACTSTKPTYGYVTSVTNAAGEPTTTKYYSCTGLVQSKTDPNGNIWSYNYDEFGRPTLVHNPDGGETTWSYSGAVSSTENTTLTGSMNLVRTTVLDALGRLSQTPA